MTRYIGQRDECNCGPIAIVNAEKWAGTCSNGRERTQELVQKTGSSILPGCWPTTLESHLKRAKGLGVEYYINKPTVSQVNKALDQGFCVLMRKLNRREGGHYYLIISRTKQTYMTINHSGKARHTIRQSILTKELRRRHTYPGSHRFPMFFALSRTK